MNLPLADFQSYTSSMISLLRGLVELESPTHEKSAVDRLGAHIAAELLRLSARLEIVTQKDAGDHLIARWGPDSTPENPGILTLCHIDTVYPQGTLEHMPCVEREGRLHGPGVLDMKAGTAILLTAIEALQKAGWQPERPLTALFTTDEETGSRTSRALIEELARQALVVLCLEPGRDDGGLKTWRKGVGHYHLSVHGRSAHAGANHAEGRSAIHELAYQVIAIQRLTDYHAGTTLNVGVIQGGTASNVVPEQARAEIDLRVMNEIEAERVHEKMAALQPVLDGTRLELSGGINRPPMPADTRMLVTFARAQEIAAIIGLDLHAGGAGGGSDANFVSALGVPVLDGLGAWGHGMHSEEEYIWIDSLPQRLALLAALISEWK